MGSSLEENEADLEEIEVIDPADSDVDLIPYAANSKESCQNVLDAIIWLRGWVGSSLKGFAWFYAACLVIWGLWKAGAKLVHDTELLWLIGAAMLLWLVSRRWFWIAATGIGGLAAGFTTLACIFHFQIMGALGAFLLMGVSWWLCGLISEPGRYSQ